MYGMSDKFGMMCLATVENQYLDGRAGLICGEDTAGQIDAEVLAIINSSYDEAMKLLTENRAILDHISDYLYEKETITGKEFMEIFREMRGEPDASDSASPDEEKKDATDYMFED
jgi:cell division protease FtsH